MKTEIVSILAIIGVVLIFIGMCFHSFVSIRKYKRKNSRYFAGVFEDLTSDDIRLLKIGTIIAFLGFLIIVVIRLTVGGTIK